MENLTHKMRKYISNYQNFESEVIQDLKESILYSKPHSSRQLLIIDDKYFSLFTLQNLNHISSKFVRTCSGVKLLREFEICDDSLQNEIKIKHKIFAISTLAQVKSKYKMYKEIYMDTSTTLYIASKFGTFEIGKLCMRDEFVGRYFIHSLIRDCRIDIMPSNSSRFSKDLKENMTELLSKYEVKEFSFDEKHKVHISFVTLNNDYFRSNLPDKVLSTIYIGGEKYFDVPNKHVKAIEVNVVCDENKTHSFSTYISEDDFTSKNLSKNLLYDIELLGAEFYLSDELSLEGNGAKVYDSDEEISYDLYHNFLKN